MSEDWATQLVERLVVEPLVLLETEASIEHHGSTRASVLVVPFTGDPDFFELDPRPLRSRSGPGYMPGPFGRVTEDALHLELTNTPGLAPGEHVVETRLAPVRNHVHSLRSALEWFQADLRAALLQALEQRREQAEVRRVRRTRLAAGPTTRRRAADFHGASAIATAKTERAVSDPPDDRRLPLRLAKGERSRAAHAPAVPQVVRLPEAKLLVTALAERGTLMLRAPSRIPLARGPSLNVARWGSGTVEYRLVGRSGCRPTRQRRRPARGLPLRPANRALRRSAGRTSVAVPERQPLTVGVTPWGFC